MLGNVIRPAIESDIDICDSTSDKETWITNKLKGEVHCLDTLLVIKQSD